jgi:hypothetical protein
VNLLRPRLTRGESSSVRINVRVCASGCMSFILTVGLQFFTVDFVCSSMSRALARCDARVYYS